jgi:hypothetical protein
VSVELRETPDVLGKCVRPVVDAVLLGINPGEECGERGWTVEGSGDGFQRRATVRDALQGVVPAEAVGNVDEEILYFGRESSNISHTISPAVCRELLTIE